MKSKLIKYPYAKPQYHWDRSGFNTDTTYYWDYTIDTTEKDIPIKNARKLYRQNGDVTIGIYPKAQHGMDWAGDGYIPGCGYIGRGVIKDNVKSSKDYYLDHSLGKKVVHSLKDLGLYITYDKYLHQGTNAVTIKPGEEYYSFGVSTPNTLVPQAIFISTFENHSNKADPNLRYSRYSSSLGTITLRDPDYSWEVYRGYCINLAEFIEELTDTPKQFTINYYKEEFHYADRDKDEPTPMGQITIYASWSRWGGIDISFTDGRDSQNMSLSSRTGNYGVHVNKTPKLERVISAYTKDIDKIFEDVENTIWNLNTGREGEDDIRGYQIYYKQYWKLTRKQLTDSKYLYKMEFTSTDENIRKRMAESMNLINYYIVGITRNTATEPLIDYYYPHTWDLERTLIGTNMQGYLHRYNIYGESSNEINGCYCEMYSTPAYSNGDELQINTESTIYPFFNHFRVLENNKFEQYEYNNIQVHITNPNLQIYEYTEEPITARFDELAHLSAEDLNGYLHYHYGSWDGGYRPNIESFVDGLATIKGCYKKYEIGTRYPDLITKWTIDEKKINDPTEYGFFLDTIKIDFKELDNYETLNNAYVEKIYNYQGNSSRPSDIIFVGTEEALEIPEATEFRVYERKDHDNTIGSITGESWPLLGIKGYSSDIVFTCSWAEAWEFFKKHGTNDVWYTILYKTTNGEILGDHMPDTIPDGDTIDFNKTMYYLYTVPESNSAKVSDVYKTEFTVAELETLENCTYDSEYAHSESSIYKLYKYEKMNPKDTYEIKGIASGSVSSKDPTAYPFDGTIGLYTYKYSHNEFNGYIRDNILYDVVLNEDENFLPKTEVINQQLYVWMMKEMVDGALVDLYKVYSARRHTYPDNGEYNGRYFEFLPEDSTGDGTDSYVQTYGDLWYGEAITDIVPAAEEIDSSLIWRNPVYDKIINNTASINYDTIAAGSLEIDTRLTLAQANALIGSMFIYKVDFQNSNDWINKGFFWIDGVENTGTAHVKIYAHDQVYKLNKYVDDWIGTLTYPMTLNSYYHALLDYCGIYYDAKEDKILNGDFPIYNNFTAVKLTATELMKYITELAGGYFHTDRYNKAHISSYKPNPTVYDYSQYNYLNYSSYNSDLFNEFKFIRNNKIYYDKKIEPENEPKVIFIKDNPLIGNDNLTTQVDTVVDNIYNQTSAQLSNYRNGTIKFFADFGINVGDIIGVMTYDETQEAPMFFIKMAIMSEHIDDNGITYESYGELEYPIESDGTRTSITYIDTINGEMNDMKDHESDLDTTLGTLENLNEVIGVLENTNKQVNTNSTNISTMAQSMNTLINNQNTYSVSSANGLGTVVLNGTLNDILLKTYADSTYNKKTDSIPGTRINDGSIPVAKINPNELNQYIAGKVTTTNCVSHGSFSWLGKDKPHWNLFLGSFDESGKHFMNGLVISAGGNLTNDNKYYHIISNFEFIIDGQKVYGASNLSGPAIPKSMLEGK